jgi:3',5'-cyclic AMP phosphodiesterase CpdA
MHLAERLRRRCRLVAPPKRGHHGCRASSVSVSIGRREFLLGTPPILASLGLGACAGKASDDAPPRERVQGGSAPRARTESPAKPYDPFTCSAVPVAHVLELGAPDTAPLREALAAAGFDVRPLPDDISPTELHGLLVIPAYASSSSAYASYMERHAADLYTFVDGANVLLELTQDPSDEPSPPFLPTSQTAKRGEGELEILRVRNTEHPLVAGLESADGLLAVRAPALAEHPYVSQGGFETILADEADKLGVLLEGAYGQGRFVLAALRLAGGSVAAETLRARLLANLFEHVRNVCARVAPEISLAESEASTRFTKGSSMLAVLPDTQVYSLLFPGLYAAQTSWLRNHARSLDIRYVLQLGDITHNNTKQEWERAAAAMSLLGGVVPLAIVPGNHDYGPSGNASTRETKLNDYFSFESASAMPTFGGAYEDGKLENTYHLFSIAGRDFVLLALEWGPRDDVIAWANEVMDGFPERDGILATHAYLNNDSRRYDHTDKLHSQRFNPHDYGTPGGVNDGQELWEKLVRRHRFVMTLNGHVLGSGVGYLASVTDAGNTCHQMLSNYQMREQGGEGYLRLLEFMPDGVTVKVFTYSPLFDKFLDDERQNFTITLEPK